MIKIRVNHREVPLMNALLHISQSHLQHKFDIREYDQYSIELCTNTAGKIECDNYSYLNTGFMIHILQLVQAVRGFGMDNVPTPTVFASRQIYWVHLQQLTGETKVKAALLYLGFYKLEDPGAAAIAAMDADLEQVCEAYAMFAEDRRVSIDEWLAMIPKQKKAFA